MNKLFGLAAAIALASPALAQERPLGLQGVKIAVADYEPTTRFYSILGMVPGTAYNPREHELKWADPAKGVPIIMVRDESGRSSMVKGGSFIMVSVADVAATVARLKAAGFPVTGEPLVIPQATIQMIKDPDGNTIELLGPPAAGAAGGDHGHDH
jgi:predicted enzyme related to lactoylglutathione lyase